MIWTAGEICPRDRLVIPIDDRIFEHGLGLFETFRTWNGRAPFLDRHLARLRRSALDLGIELEDVPLPTQDDLEHLTRAVGWAAARVRLTVSGGRPPELRSTAWMMAARLPASPRSGGYRVVDAPWPVAVDDRLTRYKTLNYWSKRIAHDHAQSVEADEAMIASVDGRIWEGSHTSLFVIQGRRLITPPTSGPLVPGILRGLVLERAETAGFVVSEVDVSRSLVAAADEVFLTNSVRGLIPVQSWVDLSYQPIDTTFPATDRLRHHLQDLWPLASLLS